MTTQVIRHRVRAVQCPSCGAQLDAAAVTPGNTDTAAPAAGDVSCCLYCGHLAVYTEAQTLRAPTIDESNELAADFRVMKIVEMTIAFAKEKGFYRGS